MTSASLCRVFGPGFFAPAAELGGAPAAYTLERGTRYTAQIMVRGYGRCVPGLTRPFIARASSTRPRSPFYESGCQAPSWLRSILPCFRVLLLASIASTVDLEDHPSIRGASFSPQANDWILGLPILFSEHAVGSSRRRYGVHNGSPRSRSHVDGFRLPV